MLQNLQTGLQSKVNKLITPFQTVSAGALSGVLITTEVDVVCVVLSIILPSWTGILRDKFCFGLRFQVMLLLWQHNPRW